MTETRKRPQTKAAQAARSQLIWDLTYLRRERLIDADIRDEVPEAWHTLEADIPTEEPKEKISLYLDKSVAKVFKAMGKGYQSRINRLLRTWVQMKIAEEVKLDAALEARVARNEAALMGRRDDV
ncbi:MULTISPECIES: BrnA antitoxin family protein [Shimia]|uniref:BrnA antitoxin family protein n=1 Tax=Shimia TaxID=573139 RepID=UPI001FB3D5A5|nr:MULTISPECIES: BrnA antitoxin family protein [Shimia]MDV4145140.1 BrnA antitoxin family protein [Shimia sp. FJ5]